MRSSAFKVIKKKWLYRPKETSLHTVSKLAAEGVIQKSGLPWSILRAEQFHGFVDSLLHMLTKLPFLAFLPTDLKCQPVDEKEVAERLAEMVERGPSARLPDQAGPEVLTLGQMARAQLKARNVQRMIIPIRLPGKTIQGFRSGYNTALVNRSMGKSLGLNGCSGSTHRKRNEK